MMLFTVGPVEMFPYTLKSGGDQIPYFRTPEFSEIMLENEALVKEIGNAGENDRVAFLTASGTGAMEASIMNCLTKEDRVLVIDGGSFGHRFVQMCELHQIPHEIIDLPFGEALTEKHLEPYADMPLTALLVNIDETSTAQLYPTEMLRDFCKKKNMLFFVDAISSFLVDPFDFSGNGMDVAIVSSQKALALAPGISFVILSERILKERVANIESGCMYLDFKDHLKNGERGQTPFTPAVQILIQLLERLRHVKEEGIENVIAYSAEVARDFRERVRELPVKLPDYPLSNACTPLIFEEGNAKEVYEALKSKYGLVLTPNGGPLAPTVLRVGHLGNHTIEDNILLIEKLKEVL